LEFARAGGHESEVINLNVKETTNPLILRSGARYLNLEPYLNITLKTNLNILVPDIPILATSQNHIFSRKWGGGVGGKKFCIPLDQ